MFDLHVAAAQFFDASFTIQALWVAAWAALLQGEHDSALKRLDECARISGDEATAAHVTCLRGTSTLFRGRLDEAAELYESAAASFAAVGDTAGATFALFQLAITQAHLDDPQAAAATAQRAVSMAEDRGERMYRSYALWALGFAAWVRGDLTPYVRDKSPYAAAAARSSASRRSAGSGECRSSGSPVIGCRNARRSACRNWRSSPNSPGRPYSGSPATGAPMASRWARI